MDRREFSATTFAALAGLAAAPLRAQSYPNGPIRLIVPFPAGGTADFVARLAGNVLAAQLKASVVVENRVGANGNIGTEAVARAAPDGQTLLLGSTPNLAINPSLYKRAPFDTLRDFTPIAQLAFAPNVLVVHPSVKATSVAELVAFARANPGKLRFASGGNGSTGHLAIELLNLAAGIQTLHVPYRGGPQAVTDLIGGQVDALFFTIPTVLQHVQTGKLRAIALASAQRTTAMADVPTFAEAGLKEVDASPWFGLLAPAGTPAPVVDRLQSELLRAWQDPEIRARLAGAGADQMNNGPQAFAAMLRQDLARWAAAVKRSGASLD